MTKVVWHTHVIPAEDYNEKRILGYIGLLGQLGYVTYNIRKPKT
jgi:hypothetical protein